MHIANKQFFECANGLCCLFIEVAEVKTEEEINLDDFRELRFKELRSVLAYPIPDSIKEKGLTFFPTSKKIVLEGSEKLLFIVFVRENKNFEEVQPCLKL